MVFSSACGITRPDVNVCIVNAEKKHRMCFNLKKDYDDDGRLKPGAMPVYYPNETIEDLNKSTVIDSPYDTQNPSPGHFEDGLARIKAYIAKLREAYKNCK